MIHNQVFKHYSLLTFPKNLERRTGPSSSLALPASLLLDLDFFSFFDLLDLDLDLLDPLSSSSLLEESEDDEEELDAEDLLECYKSRGNERMHKTFYVHNKRINQVSINIVWLIGSI